MSFLQKIGNALSRFMYGRNGADQLGLTTIWAVLLLDVVNMFIRQQTVHLIISWAGEILVRLVRPLLLITGSAALDRPPHLLQKAGVLRPALLQL